MQFRARLTLGVLFIAFAAGVALILLPVSTDVPSAVAGTRTSSNCGSIALHAGSDTDRVCSGALRRRAAIALQVTIAGFAFGIVDAALAYGAHRRRGRYAPTRMLGDAEQPVHVGTSGRLSELDRLMLLYETGAISAEHFAAHRAGILIRS
jgi:hypothetical protein